MVQMFMAAVLLVLLSISIAWSIRRPSAAIAVLVSVYTTEQILMTQFPSLIRYSWVYNLFVGFICTLAIAIAVVRRGLPRVPGAYLAMFAGFAVFVCASLLWTSSPSLARTWVGHFIAEIPLAVLLPIATVRKPDDLYPFFKLTTCFALVAAVGVISSPLQSEVGRTYLIEGGTVLSPADLMGTALIFAATLDRPAIGWLFRLRVPLSLVFAMGLFLSGARGQFFLAIALSSGVVVLRQVKGSLRSVAQVAVIAVMASTVTLASIFVDSVDLNINTSERYTSEGLEHGLKQRIRMLEQSADFRHPFLGHGIGGWSYSVNKVDGSLHRLEGLVLHPHNSLAQVYFELGLVGLTLFVAMLVHGFGRARSTISRFRAGDPVRVCSLTVASYLAFAFVISLKQATFLSAMGIYLSISILCVLSMLPNQDQESPG